MKKEIKIAIAVVAVAALALGCGTSSKKSEYSKYISLGQYKGIEIEGASTEVTEEEVQAQIDQELSYATTKEPITDRDIVANGDVANIDFEGLLDNVAFDGGTGTTDLTIGSGQFIEGFEEQLVGVKVGDKVSINVTFPADYQNTDLAGKPVVFNVTVNSISKTVQPELNEEYVLANTSYKTVDEYKDGIRKTLEESKESSAKSTNENAVWGVIFQNVKVKKYPQELLTEAQENVEKSFGSYAEQYSMDLDQFVQQNFNETLDGLVKRIAMQKMTIAEIAAKEGITVSDDQFNEEVSKLAEQYSYEDSGSLISDLGGEENYRFSLLLDKVNNFVLENAIIKGADSSESSETSAE